ncbi:MAG: hypothetical protein IT580_23635 [Verrucomicrobiales bacterium]|nr:hypothetical protein [Verrucomicrobiales bacterium]
MSTATERCRCFGILVLAWVGLGATLSGRGAPLSETDGALHLRLPSPSLEVSGLPWYGEDAPVLRRLPERLRGTFRAPVWGLAQSPSGGRIRFRTDSSRLAILARNPNSSTMHHMTSVGQNGFDLYVDGEYRQSAWPDAQGQIEREWTLGEGRAWREVTIYLPLYKPVTVERLTFEPESKVASPSPFALPRPLVFYGSSITQGGCAANPGLSYAAIVARAMRLDFVNLGFSGNGMGEPEVAKAMAEIDAAAFVLDYWANPSADVYRETLPPLVAVLRLAHPQTPILVIGPFWFPGEATSADLRAGQEAKRRFGREFVAARRREGDRAIRFVDGLEMLSREQASGLVDGVHPNSLGFHHCAVGLEPHLRRALGWRSGRR